MPALVLAASGVALLAGCGQKGALFLPTGEAAANRATLPQALNPTPGASPSTTSPAASQQTPLPTLPASAATSGTGTANPAPRP